MRKILIGFMIMMFAGGAYADGWTMPWDLRWQNPLPAMFGPADMRSDRVPVLLSVETMPYSELEALCGEREALRGCATGTRVFLLGESASEHVLLFAVQYATYETLNIKCGAAEPCFEDNILYTMEYSTRGPGSEYRMGQIGDLVNEEFNLGIPYNGRVPFAQLFMGILAG